MLLLPERPFSTRSLGLAGSIRPRSGPQGRFGDRPLPDGPIIPPIPAAARRQAGPEWPHVDPDSPGCFRPTHRPSPDTTQHGGSRSGGMPFDGLRASSAFAAPRGTGWQRLAPGGRDRGLAGDGRGARLAPGTGRGSKSKARRRAARVPSLTPCRSPAAAPPTPPLCAEGEACHPDWVGTTGLLQSGRWDLNPRHPRWQRDADWLYRFSKLGLTSPPTSRVPNSVPRLVREPKVLSRRTSDAGFARNAW